MVARSDPYKAPPRAPSRLRAALTRAFATTLESLPALIVAWLCLRVAESWHAALAGLRVSVLFGPALANDLLALARHGFVFLTGGLVLALIPSRR
jgi:hypothetical protein